MAGVARGRTRSGDEGKPATSEKARRQEKVRAATLLTGKGVQTQQIVISALESFQQTIDQLHAAELEPLARVEALSKLSLALHRTMQGLGRADPELSRLGVALDVIQALIDFIGREFPHMNEAFLAILRPFADELARDA